MKTAIFQYKCRLCGMMYDGEHTSEANAQQFLLHAVYGLDLLPETLKAFMEIVLISTHTGCPMGYGVSDLCGYVKREDR